MASTQIDLPSTLVQKIQEKLTAPKSLNQVVAEAIEQWLEREGRAETEKDKALRVLGQAGLVMSPEAQRAMAETLLARLPPHPKPTLAEVEAALAKVRVPLSEEILAMRGER
jgi:hypothetical protein